ncbi:STAS domain-containing protein [Ferriphaselus sp. R-1]|uniref:STAS domain-containing protein n=1 Tax=Ferriphaselus sp. R-1 TaxID=1485544 RepID=UPI001929CA97|nr:STAS domain-containing protein [Ferriphaselus sp. R-1]
MIHQAGNRLAVSGELTMVTVAHLHDLVEPADPGSPVVVDLAEVEVVDSAAVGLLLAWLRQAQARGIELRYSNLPPNLISLARMYGVDGLLAV